MKVFISWSGARSRHFAAGLRDWIEAAHPDVSPWMSEHDIRAGTRWADLLDKELADAQYGILVVTADNVTAPWMLFEAGALARAIETTRVEAGVPVVEARRSPVVPLLVDIEPGDVVNSPLTLFQMRKASEDNLRLVIEEINDLLDGKKRPVDWVRRQFTRCWPEFQTVIESMPAKARTASVKGPSTDEKLDEILRLLRSPRDAQNASLPVVVAISDEAVEIRTAGSSARADPRSATILRALARNGAMSQLDLEALLGVEQNALRRCISVASHAIPGEPLIRIRRSAHGLTYELDSKVAVVEVKRPVGGA